MAFFQRRRGGKLVEQAYKAKANNGDELSSIAIEESKSITNSRQVVGQESTEQPSQMSVCLGKNDSDQLLLPTTIRKEMSQNSSQRSEIRQNGENAVKSTVFRIQQQPIATQVSTTNPYTESTGEANFLNWLQGDQARKIMV